MVQSRSRGPSAFAVFSRTMKTLIAIGLVALVVWATWRYGRPMYGKIKLNPEVESAAINFAHQLPETAPGQPDLLTAVTSVANDKLRSHLAKKARWHVAFGRHGDDLTVVRDDLFTPGEKAFVARVVNEAKEKADPSEKDYEVLDFPLGAVVERVDVGNDAWYVAAVWCE
jgi:hypothetical protein